MECLLPETRFPTFSIGICKKCKAFILKRSNAKLHVVNRNDGSLFPAVYLDLLKL